MKISKNSRMQYSVSNAVQFEMYIDLGDDFTYQKPHVILINYKHVQSYVTCSVGGAAGHWLR